MSGDPAVLAAEAQNRAEQVERELVRSILAGTYAPGVRLPTLHQLSETFQVNPSTMQRSMARLEARGLVTARQGSGYRVNDPFDTCDLSLLPDWLAATGADPERSLAIFADLLEVRRVLAARLLARHRLEILDVVGRLAAQADQLAGAERADAPATDLAFAKAVVHATGNIVASAVLNSLAMVLATPPYIDAIYEDPSRNAASMRAVIAALAEGGEDLEARLEAAMASVDRHSIEAVRRLMGAEAIPNDHP